jgi:peptidylprolyl isomerase
MLRRLFLIVGMCAALAFVVAGCGGDDSSETTGGTDTSAAAAEEPSGAEETTEAAGGETGGKPTVSVPDGPAPAKLETRDIKEGSGPAAKAGDAVTVNYVGVLYDNGQEFDASWNRGEPFTFTLGAGEVIPGWDQGVTGMKPGGQRELIIPPDLAYGSTENGPIPANSTLVFVVDLVSIN